VVIETVIAVIAILLMFKVVAVFVEKAVLIAMMSLCS